MAYTYSRTTNHRIIEWFELEATFKYRLVQLLFHGQGHLSLDQVAQSPVLPDLEHFQWWGIHNFSGQPVLVFHQQEENLSYIQSKSNFFLFKIIISCHITTGPGKKSFSIFLLRPLRVEGHSKFSLEPSLLQTEQPQLSQLFFREELFQSSGHFHGPPLVPF